MDRKDYVIIGLGLSFFIGLIFGTFLVPSVYAQEESQLQKEAGNVIGTLLSWIYETADEGMRQVIIPEDNPINFTKEEAVTIYDQGKKTTDSGIDFIKQLHKLSGDLAQGALPFPVSADIIFLISAMVIGLIIAFRHKRTVKDLGYIAIGIIIVAVILTVLTLNLS